jgi:hypothetical protein
VQNIEKATKENEDVERKQMSSFFEKKEADLSGRKNRPPRKGTPDRKPNDRKGKNGNKEKVNGNGNHDSKTDMKPDEEGGSEVVEAEEASGNGDEEGKAEALGEVEKEVVEG